MAYDLKFHPDVEKQLQAIGKKARERIAGAVRSLRDDPRPRGCEKLHDDMYRIRVGDYRVIYAVFDRELIVVVCRVAGRSERTYRNLETLRAAALRVAGPIDRQRSPTDKGRADA